MAAEGSRDLEERLLRLERFRYAMLGRVNALTTMTLTLWGDWLQQQPEGALQALEKQTLLWLQGADDAPYAPTKGADPTHLDLVSQEYRDTLEQMTSLLKADAERRLAKSARTKAASKVRRRPAKRRKSP